MGQVEALLFVVLMLGVGLGTAAAAFALRRPTLSVTGRAGSLVVEGNPTPDQVLWLRAMLPEPTAVEPEPTAG